MTTVNYIAYEEISAGDLVNVFEHHGSFKIRKADTKQQREAHGFIVNNVEKDAIIPVHMNGVNKCRAILKGATIFLGFNGEVTSDSKEITGLLQIVGVAISEKEFYFRPHYSIIPSG